MSKICLLLIGCISGFIGASQMPVLRWAHTFDENNFNNYRVYNNGRTVGVDGDGNVYSAGLFEYAIDLDPGPAVYSVESPAYSSIYISKLDSSGNFIWGGLIPTSVSFGQINLRVDEAGNTYLTSDLSGPADMDPGPGVFILSPIGFRDAFIVKIDTDGNLVWAKNFGGPGDTGSQGLAVDVDLQGNVYVGGSFNNTQDFDPGPGVFNITASAHIQAFIVKLTGSGNFVWAKQFGNSPQVYGGSTILNMRSDGAGNLHITGTFARDCDFDPGPGLYTAVSSPGSAGDGFICKLDGQSNFVWVKTLGQNGTNNHHIRPFGIDFDGANNILIAGFYLGDFDFDPGVGTQVIYCNPYDAFILKLNSLGEFIWVKTIGASGASDTGNDVAVDFAGNVYLVGSFSTSVDFDPGPDTFIINSPYYGAEALVKISPEKNFN